jgi:hypothetical protein
MKSVKLTKDKYIFVGWVKALRNPTFTLLKMLGYAVAPPNLQYYFFLFLILAGIVFSDGTVKSNLNDFLFLFSPHIISPLS